MNIKYKNTNLMKQYESKVFLTKHFDERIYKSYVEFKNYVTASTNFQQLKRVRKSYRIELLSGKKKDLWSARLSKQYRVEFKWDKDTIIDITVHKIHPHKYNK